MGKNHEPALWVEACVRDYSADPGLVHCYSIDFSVGETDGGVSRFAMGFGPELEDAAGWAFEYEVYIDEYLHPTPAED